jgi:hypothetical protein
MGNAAGYSPERLAWKGLQAFRFEGINLASALIYIKNKRKLH